jgi:CRISPR system Cascade subunit CasA
MGSSIFNLLAEAWLPVRRSKGPIDYIRPAEITSDHSTNPVVALAWLRPDFDLAAQEFLIGLFAAIYPAEPRDPNDWVRLFHEPPPPEELQARLAPFAHAFVLDGDGPRFLQDIDPLDGDRSPVESLFIEAPGAITVKQNKDLLVKHGRLRVLCRPAAAMALYTLQQFAPSGGAGHRTSLRGGGPLVTLALPVRKDEGGKEKPATLWQRLWLNTPADCQLDIDGAKDAFPWLVPTRTSAKKETVNETDAHKLQTFFGMPRRIRLVFEHNTERVPCDLTGTIDDVILTGFRTSPWGMNYGAWRHPLSPYYKVKPNAPETLPVHAPEGRLAYRQWLGLVYRSPDGTRLPAQGIVESRDRLTNLGGDWLEDSRFLVGGFAMDNMKALAFAETELPLHCIGDDRLANKIATLASCAIDAAVLTTSALGTTLRLAFFGPRSEVKTDTTLLEAARERLWDETDNAFHRLLDDAIEVLSDDPDGEQRDRLAEQWRSILQHHALKIFDDTAPIESFDQIPPEDVVEARKRLFFALSGKKLYDALGLPPPEPKKKSTKQDKRSGKGELHP